MASRISFHDPVEDYFTDLLKIRRSGGGTPELSYYSPLVNLLNAVGAQLEPTVFCLSGLRQLGAGHPDLGLYTARQVERNKPSVGQLPERGVVEVKPVGDDAWLTAESTQVSQYWQKYRLVFVTNTRDFLLLGEDEQQNPVKLESFRLAESPEAFEAKLQKPGAFARETATSLGEYLTRVLSHRATLTEPRDVAWLLASYARDGLARVAAADSDPSIEQVRETLEEALGVRFEDARGVAFFRSTLIQTLFYGVFSAWVLWSRAKPPPTGPFRWREAVWHLRAPVIQSLFHEMSSPASLQALGLVEVLDWTAAALDRVEREAFFERFSEGEVVPYFYEPFLEAFDPQLRKELGVWYTPAEVVRYMVARVDAALKDDLGISDGLAAEHVYVLDPCCGTGAYLCEVLRRVAANLDARGMGAAIGKRIKQAAMSRVFGFEIMPAPFVIAHLQVGLTMEDLDARFSEDDSERAGIFLTNALTGWEPQDHEPLPLPALEEERDRADRVKQETPVLVVLGNPPYNGFAGVAVSEEQKLLDSYRKPKRVRLADKRGLNDLYVRFFRMAERRITEKTGQGVVCLISNYSWLDGLSFGGMRERYLEQFDVIRVDSLNGDKRRTGKKTPDGKPDPSIFSTPEDPVGIQVGTAITTLVRNAEHTSTKTVGFRDFWGETKREILATEAAGWAEALYLDVTPQEALSLALRPIQVSEDWVDWPALPDLFPKSFPGIHTGRDKFLVDIDKDSLQERIKAYFDAANSDETIAELYPAAMRNSTAFKVYDGREARKALLDREEPLRGDYVRDSYRPFDDRWLYWEADRRLLTAPSPNYLQHIREDNLWLSAAKQLRRGESEPQACFTRNAGSFHLIERGAAMFPAWLIDDGMDFEGNNQDRRPNLSDAARRYLDRLGLGVDDLFYCVLATLHDPAYRDENAGGMRMGWPRIPLPGWPDGKSEDAATQLAASSRRGRTLAELLDVDRPVRGVTTGDLRPEIAAVAVPATTSGNNMSDDEDDFVLTAGWGYANASGSVMPGAGNARKRDLTTDERAATGDASTILGPETFDVYLNDNAYWSNVPDAVWHYELGGYQVLKKWLSYREGTVLNRPISVDELEHFTDTARRIAAILLHITRQ